MSDHTVNVDRAVITGWPDIADLSVYTGVDQADPSLLWALDAAIDYGNVVLTGRYAGVVPASVFRACLDYAGSIYTERIGQADIIVEGFQGSSPQQRYRRILLANRFVAIA
jgi:hypothetical protein